MLTRRQAEILSLVIQQYVDTAQPVPSQAVSRAYQPAVSSATIRNEMAALESEGLLDHPHTSAGRIPTERGYRFFVGSLMQEPQLPWEVQQTIRHQFHQIEGGLESWLHLAASLLAQFTGNAAIVTAPHTVHSHVKHIELVGLQDYTALLVVVLDQGRLRQQILRLPEALTQDRLSASAGKLSKLFSGCTLEEIESAEQELDALEQTVMLSVEEIMRATDDGVTEEAYLEGLRLVLDQPEFNSGERALGLLEMLDQRNVSRSLLLRALAREGVSVMIGAENPRLAGVGEMMRACSMVISPYGAAGEASGALAVLGPMRMRYAHAVSTVRYLSDIMSDLLSAYYE